MFFMVSATGSKSALEASDQALRAIERLEQRRILDADEGLSAVGGEPLAVALFEHGVRRPVVVRVGRGGPDEDRFGRVDLAIRDEAIVGLVVERAAITVPSWTCSAVRSWLPENLFGGRKNSSGLLPVSLRM
ncbi:MAG: hypothetical protein R3E96_05130 [Planctomycetota bacterium]